MCLRPGCEDKGYGRCRRGSTSRAQTSEDMWFATAEFLDTIRYGPGYYRRCGHHWWSNSRDKEDCLFNLVAKYDNCSSSIVDAKPIYGSYHQHASTVSIIWEDNESGEANTARLEGQQM